MSRTETAFRRVVYLNWVLLGEKCGSNSGIGLRHGVFIDHTAHVACVARDLLATHLMSGTRNPVLRVLAQVTINVFVHLGASREVNNTHHALLEGNTAEVLLNTSGLTDLFIDSTRSFAEKIIFLRNMARISRQVLTRPEASILGHMLRRLTPLMRHVSVAGPLSSKR